jgi:hypothetical protein
MVAGTADSRELRDMVEGVLRLEVNAPFKGLVMRPEGEAPRVEFEHGLTFTVLSPAAKEMEAYQKKWDEDLKKQEAKARSGHVAAREPRDRSVFNLSSIAVLAELGGRSLLLTGDAHGDQILAGLEAAGRLPRDGSPLRVDVLKLPHHASRRNVTAEFFQRVVAERYVVSANGKHSNPDLETLELLHEARGRDPYTLYFTFPERAYEEVEVDTKGDEDRREALKAVDGWLRKHKAPRPTVVYREPDRLGVAIALGDEQLEPA